MLPVPLLVPSVALVGADKVAVKVSVSASSSASLVVLTLKVFEVSPAAKFRVPVASLKSLPSVAPLAPPPLAVVWLTLMALPLAALSETVKVIVDPSATAAGLLMPTVGGLSVRGLLV